MDLTYNNSYQDKDKMSLSNPIRRLEKVGFSRDQAEVIVTVSREALNDFVPKQTFTAALEQIQLRMENSFKDSQAVLMKELYEMRLENKVFQNELRAEIKEFRNEVKAEIKEHENKTEKEFTLVRADIISVKADITTLKGEMKVTRMLSAFTFAIVSLGVAIPTITTLIKQIL